MTREEREAAVDWFAMRVKLKMREPRNEAKGGWRDTPIAKLEQLLHQEVRELFQAIELWERRGGGEDAVINEACDVAAYAMMIADSLRLVAELRATRERDKV